MEKRLPVRVDLSDELTDEQRSFRARRAVDAVRQLKLFESDPAPNNVMQLFPDLDPEAA